MAVVLVASPADAQDSKEAKDSKDGFEVHDMKRPQPEIIQSGNNSTQEQAGSAPSDAVVLFDGKDLSKWQSGDGNEAKWKVVDGVMEIAPKTGSIQTKDKFGDQQIHIEWMEPKGTEGKGQGRGNSGVLIMGMYELQVLDSDKNETYADGMAGSIYGQYPPLVNPTRPQGEWNTYDVVFHAPKYEGSEMKKPATITVLFNGVLVQDHMKLLGPVKHKELTKYPAKHPEKGPLQLQDHGNPVRFRNIWVRELSDDKPKPPVRSAGAGH
jgi:hypothetical protein